MLTTYCPDQSILVGANWLNQLAEEGWALISHFIPQHLTGALLCEARCFHNDGKLARAGVGRADGFQIDANVRRDKTRWFDRSSPSQASYLDAMEVLRQLINRELYLGLFSYEAHFAVYEPNGFYARHFDAFRGARNRIVSTVFYLNDDWHPDAGGELAIWNETASETEPPLAVIPPEAGNLVVFLSEQIPHEVRLTTQDRYSIAGWFRLNDRIIAPGLQVVPDITNPLG